VCGGACVYVVCVGVVGVCVGACVCVCVCGWWLVWVRVWCVCVINPWYSIGARLSNIYHCSRYYFGNGHPK
jgi:hypothetical protein